MRKYAARVDNNHKSIEDALVQLGWGVKSLAKVGSGWPDLLAIKHGRQVWLEVKNPQRATKAGLSWDRKQRGQQDDMHAWFKRHGAEVYTILRVEDLAILDRDARKKFEGDGDRTYYPV